MRLARTLRKQQRFTDAISVYGDLAALKDVRVSTDPSEVVARRERISLYRQIGTTTEAAQEREALTMALAEGRYVIDRATFDFYSESAAPSPNAQGALSVELAQRPSMRRTILMLK